MNPKIVTVLYPTDLCLVNEHPAVTRAILTCQLTYYIPDWDHDSQTCEWLKAIQTKDYCGWKKDTHADTHYQGDKPRYLGQKWAYSYEYNQPMIEFLKKEENKSFYNPEYLPTHIKNLLK